MNLCICVSGQVRDDINSLKHLSKELLKLPSSLNVTLIFSLWENLSTKIDGALGYNQILRIFDNDISKVIPVDFYGTGFWKNFPNLFNSLESSDKRVVKGELSELFPNAIIDIEKDNLDLEFKTLRHDKNSIKMLYKRWRCNEIKKKIERTQGTHFDCVVVLRPDMMININPDSIIKSISDKTFEESSIFLPLSERVNFTNDVMAYGSSYAMDVYTSLFSKSLSNKWSGIHSELFFHLKEQGLKSKRPTHINFGGFSIPDNKISASEACKDNSFLGKLYSSYEDLTLEKIPDFIDDKYKRISFYTLLSMKYKKKPDYRSQLRALLLAEASELANFNKNNDRYRFYVSDLADCLINLNLTIDKVESVIAKEEITDNFDKNINYISQESFFVKTFFERNIEHFVLNGLWSEAKDNWDLYPLPAKFADLLRDKALEMEKQGAYETAFMLMNKAKEIRPNGQRIVNKVAEYKKVLGL
ncbi:hypothetical protein [Endozoicomonas euniceicola]|uniref:Uncharacterized protein n=1 Tax=Endozoicomonas euniceicola TaxID=1234143 RepID=A0ABY6H0E3_9GAMM|nr:hypothetical protein [Endozoicomonas euniceicola]UYM18513.1 hypothetical protein NX720_11620 [Endozoicomonas euniceicola]